MNQTGCPSELRLNAIIDALGAVRCGRQGCVGHIGDLVDAGDDEWEVLRLIPGYHAEPGRGPSGELEVRYTQGARRRQAFDQAPGLRRPIRSAITGALAPERQRASLPVRVQCPRCGHWQRVVASHSVV